MDRKSYWTCTESVLAKDSVIWFTRLSESQPTLSSNSIRELSKQLRVKNLPWLFLNIILACSTFLQTFTLFRVLHFVHLTNVSASTLSFFVLHLQQIILLLHFCIAIKVRWSSIKVDGNFISATFSLKSLLHSRFFGELIWRP